MVYGGRVTTHAISVVAELLVVVVAGVSKGSGSGIELRI